MMAPNFGSQGQAHTPIMQAVTFCMARVMSVAGKKDFKNEVRSMACRAAVNVGAVRQNLELCRTA